MLDLFGKKRRQSEFDRAYAEFISGNLELSEKKLTGLINEGVRNYHVFNLRAQIHLQNKHFDLAFKDSIVSIELETNIERNNDAYQLRNFIIHELKIGKIKPDLFELSNYFEISNIFQLFKEHCDNIINSIHNNSNLVDFSQSQRIKLMYIAYNYLYFCLIEKSRNLKSFSLERSNSFKKIITEKIKINFDTVEKEFNTKSKNPFFWLPAEFHFKPFFERTISYSMEEHLLPLDNWPKWLGSDRFVTLANYVFKKGHEINRIPLVVEADFLETFIRSLKTAAIDQPMVNEMNLI